MPYSIGEFSAQTGLSIHTLRYYELEGLLQPARTPSNHRCYTEADLAWVAFLLRLKATGMPIQEIRHYARLRQAGDATAAERLALLTAHRQTLEARISQLQTHRDRLDEKIAWYRQLVDQQNKNDGAAP